MQWFNDLKVSKKFLLVFGVIVFVAAIIGFTGIVSVRSIAAHDDELYKLQTVPIKDMAAANEAYLQMRTQMLYLVLFKSNEERQASSQKIQEYSDVFEKSLTSFEKTIQTEAGRKQYDELQSAYKQYMPLREQFIQLANAGRGEEALAITKGVGAPIIATLNKSMADLIDAKVNLAQKVADENQASAQSATWEIILILIAGIVVAIAVGIALTRFFVTIIDRVAFALGKMAEGDLTVEVNYKGKDEFGHIANSMSHMLKYFNETISQISEASTTVASAIRKYPVAQKKWLLVRKSRRVKQVK